jgi:hypothetical protein
MVAAVAAAVGLGGAGGARAQTYVQTGLLDCSVAPGIGLIVGSTKSLSCRYTLPDGRYEFYRGTINKLGLDIGITGAGRMGWAVLAPTKDLRPGSLAGEYGGVSAQASVGVGVGANALVGGSRRSIALQPLSVQTQTGVNVAAGVTSLSLVAGR